MLSNDWFTLDWVKAHITPENVNTHLKSSPNYPIHGAYPIFAALNFRKMDTLLYVISLGANVNGYSDSMDPITYYFAYLCKEANICDYIRVLLNNGAFINHINVGHTSISFFDKNVYKDLTKLFIDYGGTHWSLPGGYGDIITKWVQPIIDGRLCCRKGAITVMCLRKHIHVGKDVLSLIGKHLWSMRLAF